MDGFSKALINTCTAQLAHVEFGDHRQHDRVCSADNLSTQLATLAHINVCATSSEEMSSDLYFLLNAGD